MASGLRSGARGHGNLPAEDPLEGSSGTLPANDTDPSEARSTERNAPAQSRRDASEAQAEETQAEKHTRLRALVAEKRQMEEIEELELELAGTEPGFRARLDDEPRRGHKRVAS
jgi:hypothetical protein